MSISARRYSLILSSWLACLLGISSLAIGAAPEPITEVEGITEYRLDNGLKVLLFPDNSKPTITTNITYMVGSRHEGRGEAGMAHLLEHMVFKGTPKFPNIWGALEDHGANFNGTTWVDRTNYYETLPASDENLEFALKMEADRMVNSFVSGEELAKEMTVVRNEFEMGENNPSAVLGERMLSAAYLWHNYGKSTIGNRSDIERVPVDNLRAFYRKYYQPDNAILLVAGKFETERALELIQQYFGNIPRPTRELETTYTEEPAQDGPRQVILKRVGDVPTVGLTYHIPAGSDPEYPALALLEDMLTNQPSGYLYRRLVASGIATQVSGVAFAWAEPGVIQFSATVATGHEPQVVLATMVDTVESIGTVGITQADLERAIARRKKEYKLAMTDSSRLGVRLSESIALGDWRMFFVTRDRFEKVSLQDIKTVAGKYFVESNRTAGIFLPTDEPQRTNVPPRPDVQQITAGYAGREEVAEGEELRPDVDYIESRIVRKTLPSGIKLALLPIQTRGDAVTAQFKFFYGDEASLTGHETTLEILPSMLMRGTKRLDFQQLRDEIDRLESRISVSGGGGQLGTPGEISGSIESDRKNLVAAIELLGEIMQQPAFDPAEFDIIISQVKSSLEQSKSDPQALGMLALARVMNPWPSSSIHYVPDMEESLERVVAVNLELLKSLYEKLLGASYLEVAVVGDFDPDQVAQVVERVFGSWKSPIPYVRVAKPYRAIENFSPIVIDTPDKEMAIVATGTTVKMNDEDPDYPAMVLASYVLGQSSKSRLMNRLRHKGGLSYGAGAGFRASSQDDNASLTGMAICAPQNADQALAALREEVQQWIADGLTDQELEEAKNSYQLKYLSQLGNRRFLLEQLSSGLELGRTLEFRQQRQDKINALTNAEIRSALRDILGEAALVELKAGDPAPRHADDPATENGAEEGLPPILAQFDKNGDGKLHLEEAPDTLRPAFPKIDTNGDSMIDAAEAKALRRAAAASGSNGPQSVRP